AAYQLGPPRAIDLPPANLSMPAPVDRKNVYAGTGAGMFSPAVAGQLSRVYSPNLITGKVDVIDPETFKVIESLDAVPSPEHIVPSWDLQTLWVSGDISYRGGHADVMPIDPKTGKLGKAIDVPDSYNMYFTPDGKIFFVADMLGDGVVVIDGDSFGQVSFIRTGVGAHGLYPSRDGTKLYVANRGTHNLAGQKNGHGSVSVV